MKASQVLVLSLVLAQEKPQFKASSIVAPFLEQFIEGDRWISSQAKKIVDGVEDEDLLQYRGEWKVEPGTEELIEGDKGLVLKTLAAHSAISAKFDKPIDPKDKALVVQYEVKTQNGLECGGAYLKLLSYDKNFEPEKFYDKTPYTIMFGPDKCGSNNKVHFIFRHQNPKTKEIQEKHLVSPPEIVSDRKTNLYTLIVKPDQSFEIKINNESKKKGSLLKDFDPAVNPPKEIDDPEDKKPSDWVDVAKIPDPKATKPEDWDEDAPREIVDESATKPEDWLDDEPDTIPDPEVKKPEDWDDEEDGDWSAPTIANPKCKEVSGCGQWLRPMIKNPKYKGKWSAPLIDNPEYKGEWKPRKIANPNYFEDLTPSNFGKIGAVGFELWSMQDGFLFDNIYIGHSENDAATLAKETWAVKKEIEKAKEPEPPKESAVDQAKSFVEKAKRELSQIPDQVVNFIDIAKVDPVDAVKTLPHIFTIIILSILLPVYLITSFFTKAKAPKVAKKEKAQESPKKEESKAKSSAVDSPKATKRNTKKD